MQVSPSVRAVQVPTVDDNVAHPQFTSMYLVGKSDVFMIDTGEDFDRYRWMLHGYLAGNEGVKIVRAAITHHHRDHCANMPWLKDNFDSQLECHPEGVALISDRVPAEHLKTLANDSIIDMGGPARLRVIYTPGHSVDSICYYLEDEGVLFSGDTILGAGTTGMGDLSAYMQSLETLRALPNLKVMCPGHGPLIYDARERIEEYIKHRNEREQQIVQMLRETDGPVTSWDLMMKIYTGYDTRLHSSADRQVQTHLRKLESEGRIRVESGLRKEPTAEELAREEHDRREDDEILRRAKEVEDKARKAQLAAQENPPLAQW
ncbi:MAG: MBL fold metallo-hydrolase, partial [Chloroflexi bacterium]|nr:MBL fold metallo-hydrolase [Chloroflexota bacterium]